MKKFEKFISKLWIGVVAVSALVTPAVSHADDCCWDYDCNSACDWEWYVGVDYLYWKPCINDLDYVAVVPEGEGFQGDVDFKTRRICPEWESGYRIYLGAYSPGGMGVVGSFTQIKASASDEYADSNAVLYPSKIHPFYNQIVSVFSGEDDFFYREGNSYWDSDYKEWFVGATYHWEIDSCHHVIPFVGIAGLNYDESINSEFFADDESGEEEASDVIVRSLYDMDFKGVGVRLGTKYNSTICDCFGFYASLSGTVLVGDTDSNAVFSITDENGGETIFPSFNFIDDGCCTFVPGYQLGFGFTYDTCVCNVDLIFKIGYEFVGWYNLPTYRHFTEGAVFFFQEGEDAFNTIGSSSIFTSRTLAYHGLTAGFALKF